MDEARMKVLELVADGKITPADGARLLQALGAPGRGGGMHSFRFPMPDIRVPKIDLGHLGEVVVELKNSMVDNARKAQGQLKQSRCGRYFEFKDYPLTAALPEGVTRCHLNLEVRAGKLKLRGGTEGGELLTGRVKRVPEEPVVFTEVRDGEAELRLKHSLGRCALRVSTAPSYQVQLSNAASDSRLELEELRVDKLTVENNAGNVEAMLGALVPHIEVAVENNAGNVRLGVPASHSVRVTPSGNLSTTNFERHGLELVDGVMQAQDYESNPLKVDIVLSQNVASFTLDWRRRDGVTVGAEGGKDE